MRPWVEWEPRNIPRPYLHVEWWDHDRAAVLAGIGDGYSDPVFEVGVEVVPVPSWVVPIVDRLAKLLER